MNAILRPRPQVAKAQPWPFPAARQTVLDNGLNVWTFDLPGQLVISAELVIPVSLSAEPPAAEGVATIALRTSDEGSAAHPGPELARLVEQNGAVFGGHCFPSATICGLDAPVTRLAGALPLLAEIVREPAYAEPDVTRHVAARVSEIEQAHVNSSALASLAFRRAVFAADSRDSRPGGGDLATVRSLTADQVRQFHADHWTPQGATLVIAGDLPSHLDMLVADAFGGWRQSAVNTKDDPAVARAGERVVWVVDRPGAVQADVRIGCYGPDRSAPDWQQLQVAACAMGGSFGSRLNQTLREDRGYTYGANCAFAPLRHGGMFTMSASFRADVAARACAETLELMDVSRAAFTNEEISAAINYLVGVAPLRYDTAGPIASQAGALAAVGLDPKWITSHYRRIWEVTPEQAQQAFSARVRPDQLCVVVCGDAEQLVPELTAQGLAAAIIEV